MKKQHWCRSCRGWRRYRRVGRMLVCSACVKRRAEAERAYGYLAPTPVPARPAIVRQRATSRADFSGEAARGVTGAVSAPFDWKERQAGEHLEDRRP